MNSEIPHLNVSFIDTNQSVHKMGERDLLFPTKLLFFIDGLGKNRGKAVSPYLSNFSHSPLPLTPGNKMLQHSFLTGGLFFNTATDTENGHMVSTVPDPQGKTLHGYPLTPLSFHLSVSCLSLLVSGHFQTSTGPICMLGGFRIPKEGHSTTQPLQAHAHVHTHTHMFLYFLNSKFLKIDLQITSATQSPGCALDPVTMLNCSTLETSDLKPSIALGSHNCLSFSLSSISSTWSLTTTESPVCSSTLFSESICPSQLYFLPNWVSHEQLQCLSTLKSLPPCPDCNCTTQTQTWINFTINYCVEAGIMSCSSSIWDKNLSSIPSTC